MPSRHHRLRPEGKSNSSRKAKRPASQVLLSSARLKAIPTDTRGPSFRPTRGASAVYSFTILKRTRNFVSIHSNKSRKKRQPKNSSKFRMTWRVSFLGNRGTMSGALADADGIGAGMVEAFHDSSEVVGEMELSNVVKGGWSNGQSSIVLAPFHHEAVKVLGSTSSGLVRTQWHRPQPFPVLMLQDCHHGSRPAIQRLAPPKRRRPFGKCGRGRHGTRARHEV